MFSHNTVVFDGGIGTELYELGHYINRPFEELNLTAAADVSAVHQSYADAGAHVLTTNTFSIVRPQLRRFGIEDKQPELLIEGIRLACDVAQKSSLQVALSVGPLGELLEPLGPMGRLDAQAEFAQVAQIAQLGAHFDLFSLETFTNIDELCCAIDGIRSVWADKAIVAFISAKSTLQALLHDFVTRVCSRRDIQAVGFNCSDGPSDLLKCLQQVAPVIDLPIIVKPNAGLPRQINGRYFYMTSPDYMAKYAKRFVESGAAGVGGCCGTRPMHIRAISQMVEMGNARTRGTAEVSLSTPNVPESPSTIETPKRSRVLEVLRQNKKVISFELNPPKGIDLKRFSESIEQILTLGFQFINIPDSARAMTRVSSLHMASWVTQQWETKLCAIPHLACRDRNLIALQSDLLGAAVHGVRDLLLVTGDPPKLGNNKEATAVYDVDSIGLTRMAACLNQGLSPTGEKLGQGTGFGIGVAANPTAINLDLEVERWRYKAEMGADFAVTQPIFDVECFFRWRDKIYKHYRPHMIGIWPLKSLRNAEFLANEVPGVYVPRHILSEMEKSGDNQDEARKRGLEIALDVMDKLEQSCEGFCVSVEPANVASVAKRLSEQFT